MMEIQFSKKDSIWKGLIILKIIINFKNWMISLISKKIDIMIILKIYYLISKIAKVKELNIQIKAKTIKIKFQIS